MGKTPLELAQEAVQKAEEQVAEARNSLNIQRHAFTEEWASRNPGLSTNELLEYLKTGIWQHPTCSAADFISFLNQNLATEKQNLAFKEQNLARKEDFVQNLMLTGASVIKDSSGASMIVDSGSPEAVLNSLLRMINTADVNKNVFSLHESMESVNLNESLLNLDIKIIDKTPDFLLSEDIYWAEKEIGIEMPIDRLMDIKNQTIVLIGVSGCGKSRTCYDFCRKCWGLYFDCTSDVDFKTMIDSLRPIVPRQKSESSQEHFESESERYIECLISARWITLQAVIQSDPNVQPFNWLCIQRSRRTQKLFSDLFKKLIGQPSVSEEIYDILARSFKGECRIIFDESQYLLELLKLDYRSTKHYQKGIDVEGRFEYPRSFFSFLSRIVIHKDLRSIWCGTQMRIRNMELIYSAAGGGKKDEISIFSDFTYLEPSHVYKLLSKWLKVDLSNYLTLFEEISNALQGRPRFLIAFLQRLISSSDIDQCFRDYVQDMTTNHDSSLAFSSLYVFWKERIDWTIEPIITTESSAFNKRLVSQTLIKLCLAYLFGDGSSIAFPSDLDLVCTSLVMIREVRKNQWQASMAEPLVLSAGLNYLADKNGQVLMDYFAAMLFSPLTPLCLTAQERGHMMELVVALRFIQGWWLEPQLQKFLPKWAQDYGVKKPVGVIDCRSKDPKINMFIQQLRKKDFPWIILPSTYAGPDLRYSIFSCCIKTTSTVNSNSSMYVDVEECRKNISTMDPMNWYKSQPSVHQECVNEISQDRRFVHLRFELPETAPSMKATFSNGPKGSDYIICVDLNSEFALHFFGEPFLKNYRLFVARLLKQEPNIE